MQSSIRFGAAYALTIKKQGFPPPPPFDEVLAETRALYSALAPETDSSEDELTTLAQQHTDLQAKGASTPAADTLIGKLFQIARASKAGTRALSPAPRRQTKYSEADFHRLTQQHIDHITNYVSPREMEAVIGKLLQTAQAAKRVAAFFIFKGHYFYLEDDYTAPEAAAKGKRVWQHFDHRGWRYEFKRTFFSPKPVQDNDPAWQGQEASYFLSKLEEALSEFVVQDFFHRSAPPVFPLRPPDSDAFGETVPDFVSDQMAKARPAILVTKPEHAYELQRAPREKAPPAATIRPIPPAIDNRQQPANRLATTSA